MRPTSFAIAALCAGMLAAPTPVAAEEQEGLEPLDEELPQVTIVSRGEDTVTEFRLRGKLYFVKVTQPNGAVYYLVDRDGNGQWTRTLDGSGFVVPTWVLTTW